MCITLTCEDPSTEGRLPNGGRSFESPAVRQAASTKATSFALPVNTPPPLLYFGSVDELIAALSPVTRERYEYQIRTICDLNLPPAVSIHVIATLFGYSPSFVVALLKRPERYYRIFTIRSGKKRREIVAPKVSVKIIQRWIGGNIERHIEWLPCVFGFVSGRSSIDAASIHCGADWVYSIDLRDFFPSTTRATVQAALTDIGYEPHCAELIARLSCYGGRLAQGAPSSPVLSNLAFMRFDQRLMELSNAFDVKYTRYADDMVFSGNGTFPAALKGEIEAVFRDSDWKFAGDKEYFAEKPSRLKVHGLLVDGGVPRLTRGYRNKIRAFRHLMSTGRVREKDVSKISGHIAYANLVLRKAGR
ncbi:reverse transcriptase family protein [Burkholderia anthina]|uniref:RNA-directed DNA polymerase n=1 Tax=Burkholderia anthina TaxID=179879 RepID=A0ABS2AWW3_9BURK|nr:reverse transcriptase family protein [Burkholderia anthina]MBM2765232.1 RNA-directed DNA polymerase [Burkholderia anthina]